MKNFDAVIIHANQLMKHNDPEFPETELRSPHQRYVMFALESPAIHQNAIKLKKYNGIIHLAWFLSSTKYNLRFV